MLDVAETEGLRGMLALQFGAPEVLDDIFPVRGVIKSAQIWLELSTENLQGRALANTVRTDETEYLAGSGRGKTVELETVGGVSMGDLTLEVRGQVDNGNGAKWTLLGTDTATDAERLRDEGEPGVGRDLDT